MASREEMARVRRGSRDAAWDLDRARERHEDKNQARASTSSRRRASLINYIRNERVCNEHFGDYDVTSKKKKKKNSKDTL